MVTGSGNGAAGNGAAEIDKLADCPALAAIRTISGKWKTRILWCLRDGERHFGELRREIGVSAKVLSEQLRALERDGLIGTTTVREGAVDRTVVAYTPYGRTLIPALDLLGAWGAHHMAGRTGTGPE